MRYYEKNLEFQCPVCGKSIRITEGDDKLVCSCGKVCPIFKNIIDFLPSEEPFYREIPDKMDK